MNVSKIFALSARERTFQLKARRDAGTDNPRWQAPQFFTCKKCERRATRQVWAGTLYVCPNCGYHHPVGGYYRLSMVLDHGTFRELDGELEGKNVLAFPGYEDKLDKQRAKTGLNDAAVTATGKIGGIPAVVAVLDSRFFMGSMGTAVGGARHPRHRVCHGQAPAPYHFLGQRRRPHAGGHLQPDADGQDQRCHPALSGKRRAVHQLPDPPHHRRRDGQLCQPGRHHARGTGRPSSALPGRGSSNRPSGKSCPRGSSGRSICWTTVLWTGSCPAAR